ncbi:MAG: class I SAM-dependent methyltransferase [Acidobacteria bacterium]|nr:class I SAM-dependent methyltransferase [Acidobacteriota bacterium]
MSPDVDNANVLLEQINYYRARATEYDDWFLRLGRYDRGEDATRRWFQQVEEVRQALATLPLDEKNILELASGTGIWTEELCNRVAHLTAVDASSEMIALNLQRLGDWAEKVTFIEADLFEWHPTQEFDAVVFCFWISHIPVDRIDEFLANVVTMLTRGGTVFFLDARKEHTGTAADHVLPPRDEELMTRRLDDGREFTIIKNFWTAAVLEDKCKRVGLNVEIHETADYFQYGIGTRA